MNTPEVGYPDIGPRRIFIHLLSDNTSVTCFIIHIAYVYVCIYVHMYNVQIPRLRFLLLFLLHRPLYIVYGPVFFFIHKNN